MRREGTSGPSEGHQSRTGTRTNVFDPIRYCSRRPAIDTPPPTSAPYQADNCARVPHEADNRTADQIRRDAIQAERQLREQHKAYEAQLVRQIHSDAIQAERQLLEQHRAYNEYQARLAQEADRVRLNAVRAKQEQADRARVANQLVLEAAQYERLYRDNPARLSERDRLAEETRLATEQANRALALQTQRIRQQHASPSTDAAHTPPPSTPYGWDRSSYHGSPQHGEARTSSVRGSRHDGDRISSHDPGYNPSTDWGGDANVWRRR